MWNSMLAVTYDTKAHTMEFIPVVTEELGITLAKGERREQLLAEFEARNASLLDGTWKQGWRDFCLSKEDAYKKVIAGACNPDSTQRQNDVFGHYLDCQAHTDVWRELFPSYNLTNEK